jgi:hypothetical protein
MLLKELRHEVWQMHLELPRNGLVTWTPPWMLPPTSMCTASGPM